MIKPALVVVKADLMDVKTLCLGALDMGDATGYEIKKMFEEGIFSHYLEASYGSIYPALTKLTQDGLVTCQSEPQDRRPDKKIYSITPSGRSVLKDSIDAPIAPDRFKSEFLFVMLFTHMMSPERKTELIEDRIRELKRELAHIRADREEKGDPHHEFVRLYGEAVMEASLAFLDENRHLIEETGPARDMELAR